MVFTVSRALATLVAAMLMLLCAPVLPAAAVERPPEALQGFHSAGYWPHAAVSPAHDSASISIALAKWSGDQRSVPRDVPDGYVPAAVGFPRPQGGWSRVEPRDETAAPDPGNVPDLPQGRAPPVPERA
ncbi:hypothetical protein [Nocardiopsis ansamitocini]|uniref:Uncharacterized protein n=1 Tax=Nocardiopsis ansamitocini TaxID=1670832 RepID=A0A9W6P4H5_9ACTN|nr:hypothetical protein [Nocardiopsis ansamitocini]GLU46929.1 hypothetical protein Nans01_12800 [Nocardiopsis ansamitocini]